MQGMPLTLGGAAPFQVQNLCAAALAAACTGWPASAIRAVLARFGKQPQDNPGRLERYTYRGATVLIDYAHNPDGLRQLLQVAQAFRQRRLLLLLGQAGNREDAAIAALARTAAGFAPAAAWLKCMPAQYLLGRSADEVPALLKQALLDGGLAPERIVDVLPLPAPELPDPSSEEATAPRMIASAQEGDVLVLPLHDAGMRQRVASGLVN
jgi:cyanophycin synthetase